MRNLRACEQRDKKEDKFDCAHPFPSGFLLTFVSCDVLEFKFLILCINRSQCFISAVWMVANISLIL